MFFFVCLWSLSRTKNFFKVLCSTLIDHKCYSDCTLFRSVCILPIVIQEIGKETKQSKAISTNFALIQCIFKNFSKLFDFWF